MGVNRGWRLPQRLCWPADTSTEQEHPQCQQEDRELFSRPVFLDNTDIYLKTNASKVDNILSENPGKTLDELVAARKINADQKAQILKKPSLQASLAQLEEQIAQYKKFDQEYKARMSSEKAEFEKSFTERASKELEEAVAATKAEAQSITEKEQEQALLLLSQFLRLAAVRRGEEENAGLQENMALEGLLAQVYSGDANAVAAMVNLIQGSEETLTSVTGEPLAVTCKFHYLPWLAFTNRTSRC
jgi:hypothetical protein